MSTEPIYCEHKPSPAKLDVLGVYDWPIWKKEVSTFPWTYGDQETCYILKGRFIVTPDGVQVKPVVDVTKMGLAALTAFGTMGVLAVKMLKKSR
jgi:uncharacterized cupin superfamily protein